VEPIWSYRDEFDNEAELGKDGDTFVFTVSDAYESAYISLPKANAQDLFDVLGNGLGILFGTARHERNCGCDPTIPQRNMITGEPIPREFCIRKED